MIITRMSPLTGKIHEMELPITQQQIYDWQHGGHMIQDVFPDLTPSQREFLKTGITDEEWERFIR